MVKFGLGKQADVTTAESPLTASCPQAAVICASTKSIAKFILLAFVEEVDGECVKSEKVSASSMLMNH